MAGAAFASVIPSLLGGLAVSAVTSALKKDRPAPQSPPPAIAAPVVEPPVQMPTANDAERRAKARQSLAQQMARRGRASTILTDNADEKLGG